MRILVVGPTGRTGCHVIDALRSRDPDVSIRGLCRYPETRTRSIEVMPGNLDTGGQRTRAIEVMPGNLDTGGQRTRAIEVMPGNLDTGGQRTRAIEVMPGNLDTGGQRTRSIEVMPGNLDTGGQRTRAIEVMPGNLDTGGQRTRAHRIECLTGDLENPADRTLAVEGMDVVVHYAPAFHPRETAMGTGMIDAAVAAGVKRFVYVSALHVQAASVPGNAAKLAVEGYLAESALEWTVLRPQSFMQNIDVAAALAAGKLDLPFPLGTRQGHVDIADLAEVLAKVTFEDGHALAGYDIASDEALGTAEIAALIATVSGQPVASGEIPVAQLVAGLEAAGPGYAYVAEAALRLNAWQARSGGRGNAKTLRWLLGREPGRFEDYVRRCLGA
ncbi:MULTISPECIES: NAD(P)H-binding protein [unclassified Novosphingobium]|uniref:NmrA family NAD(P)-binding protein n=1 Tax=unclassified Novosphingobium TaxID=2644732 RepID=UPI001356C935|nr:MULTISPECIES: NAD(P)H-binding protein [unclassified Novosphingobium]